MSGNEVVENAVRELTILTRCLCEDPYPLTSGRHDPKCLIFWREDVDTLSTELERLRAIEAAAVEYIGEYDSPAPDLLYRRVVRDRLRVALAAAVQVRPSEEQP